MSCQNYPEQCDQATCPGGVMGVTQLLHPQLLDFITGGPQKRILKKRNTDHRKYQGC